DHGPTTLDRTDPRDVLPREYRCGPREPSTEWGAVGPPLTRSKCRSQGPDRAAMCLIANAKTLARRIDLGPPGRRPERGTRVAERAQDLGHGDDVEHVVVEDGDQAIGVAAPHEVVIEARHLVAGHVARAPASTHAPLERLQATVGQDLAPAPPRRVQQV